MANLQIKLLLVRLILSSLSATQVNCQVLLLMILPSRVRLSSYHEADRSDYLCSFLVSLQSNYIDVNVVSMMVLLRRYGGKCEHLRSKNSRFFFSFPRQKFQGLYHDGFHKNTIVSFSIIVLQRCIFCYFRRVMLSQQRIVIQLVKVYCPDRVLCRKNERF